MNALGRGISLMNRQVEKRCNFLSGFNFSWCFEKGKRETEIERRGQVSGQFSSLYTSPWRTFLPKPRPTYISGLRKLARVLQGEQPSYSTLSFLAQFMQKQEQNAWKADVSLEFLGTCGHAQIKTQ